jgi:hypothetical protein
MNFQFMVLLAAAIIIIGLNPVMANTVGSLKTGPITQNAKAVNRAQLGEKIAF